MANLFRRVARLAVESTLVEGLRMQFKVMKTLNKDPNTCEVTVYNLNPAHRAAFSHKGLRLVLSAGYEGSVSQIFSGDTRYTDSEHPGADWLTKIQCADGERAYRWHRVSGAFKSGTSVADVFAHVAGGMPLDTSDAISQIRAAVAEVFPGGYTTHGRASAEIDRLLKGRGFTWSIQDNKLQVLNNGAPLTGRAILLSPETGLIGSPAHGSPIAEKQLEKKPQVLKAKSLLQGGFLPGRIVKLQSREVQGQFSILTVAHTGDTMGADWYSELELIPV